MASRAPDLLHPKLKAAWFSLRDTLRDKGIDAILTCTYRSKREQLALYQQGRTAPGKIVTKSLPGKSRHNSLPSEAFDIAIIENGTCIWDTDSPAWKAAV